MKQISTMTSKGQLTVPAEVRRRLGLKQGDRVEFEVEHGVTTLRRARGAENPFLKYVGAYPAFKSFDELNDWVRDLRDDDETNR